jgi:hypothetical protein
LFEFRIVVVCGCSEHLIAAFLEFIIHGNSFERISFLSQSGDQRGQISRCHGAQLQKRKNSHLAGHSAEGGGRYHPATLFRQAGVEAGRAVAAAENPIVEIGVGEGEHGRVFFERASPGDDLIEREYHCAILINTNFTTRADFIILALFQLENSGVAAPDAALLFLIAQKE